MAKLARHALTTFVSLLFVFMWLAAGNPDPFGAWIAALAQTPCGPNPVVCENDKPVADANFELSADEHGSTIQGFATDISVNVSQRVNFKIDAPGATPEAVSIAIYRLGYYRGAGARRVATVTPTTLPAQPACMVENATGLVDCGNWAVSAWWDVPNDAVSGVYIAKLSRSGPPDASHVVFIVRNDSRTADILVQTSDTTWQAYNRYGGASLYCADTVGMGETNAGSAYANSCGQRASKVSYNRPFDTRVHSPQSFLFNAEYPMLRFLEANGFDVKYWAGVDTDRRAADLAGSNKPKVFLSSGHDEYWSGGQRAGVEAARNAGVNLAFFSGNEVYWKTRYEPSAASTDATSNPAYRTLVSYKDTLAGRKLDPTDHVATGTWRDTRFAPPVADGGRPENALIGSMWTVNSGTAAITIPASMANLRLWRNTRIATQGGGALAPSSLGYEWGEDLDNGARPIGLVQLSSTTVPNVEKIIDFGSTVATSTATHSLTLYRHTNGVLVFGASTVQWAWGLDSVHDDHGQSPSWHTPDLAMQQATVNLLSDMGATAGSRQSNIVPPDGSTDDLAPTATIVFPAAGGSVGSGDHVTITGTATDNGGGHVAGVEVSVNDGPWRPARGAAAWTFEWVPGAIGTATIRARAIDDSANQDPVGTTTAVSVVAGRCPCPSIWSASAIPAVLENNDPSPVELGLKFHSDVDGFVKGVRFYKGVGNNGTHTGNLWTSDGTLLARATFADETSSGWQQVLFDQPVDIGADTTYVVSYHTNVGQYSSSLGYFTALGADAPPLHALPSGVAGGNGVFFYGATGFPTKTFSATNYWVDVVFDTTPDTSKPVIADVTAIAVDSATAVISWSTNESATSTVEYSTDSTFPLAQTLIISDVSRTLRHSVRITNLRAETRYHFRLKSTDRAGNEGTWPPPGTPQPGPGGTAPPPRDFTTPKPTLHDTTAADFSAGNPGSVHVAEAGDGEIILPPAAGAEFSGTALPAGWSETIWSDGGSAKVGGGRLLVDGVRVMRDLAEPLAGHSLEFVATFTGDPFQHSGFGQTLASPSEALALFSTSWVDTDGAPRFGGSLAVRTSAGGGAGETSTTLGPSYFNAPHRYRIEWQPGSVTYYIDGELKASHAVSIAGPMRPVAASDFNAFSGTIAVDWIRLSPYAAAGSFLSRVFDASAVVDWSDITWTGAVPEGTALSIFVRTGMSASPDDTWTAFAPVAAPGLLGIRSRYIQYRADLTSSSHDRTPELHDLVIGSTKPTLTAANDQASVPENGRHVFPAAGAGSLIANDADSFAAATLRVVSVTSPAHGGAVVGAGGSVTYTPTTNYHGADTFGYMVSDGSLTANATVAIDVTGNIAPIANADRFDVNEDGSLTVAASASLLGNDTDAEHDPLTVHLVSPPAHGVLALGADGSFSYSPAENYSGLDEFSYKANDGFDDSLQAATVQIAVAAVNDRPFFTRGADQVAFEDAGPQTIVGWATGVNAGAPAESAQALNFIVETTNGALFAAGPAITPDGSLSYTTAPNANGSAVVTVRLHDNGGSPGVDTSDPQTFGIAVTPVNDAPSFVKGADQTVLEDGGAQNVAGWATAISAGAANESAQALDFIVSNDNGSLFLVQPAIAADGTLTWTPASNRNGSATVTVRLHDNGGAVGGTDTSAAQTFTITVTAVNDAPSFTKGADQSVLEDAAAQTVAGWATALNAGAPDESGQTIDFIVTSNNDALFAVPAAIAANGTLTYRPAPNANGTATVTVRAHDNGGIAQGVDTSASQTFTIAVAAVNDAPSFTKGADQSVGEDAGPQSVASWATLISVGPADESGQLATFNLASNTNPSLFAAGPAVDASGKLTYTPDANASGSATITLRLTDNGGVANNGIDASPAQSFVITVTARNDAPSFTKGADQSVLEDAGPRTLAAWATGLNAGAADEAGQALDFIVTNGNSSLFSAQPAITAGGTLSYTPALNANGSATVTVRLHDNGGISGGGADTSASQTFTIAITAVNDAPSFTKGADQSVAEDAGPQSVASWATLISVGPADESGQLATFNVTSNTNPSLFGAGPAVDALGKLTYTPAANASGSATITLRLVDNGGVANNGVDASAAQSFVITVTARNDAPSFTKGVDQSVPEDAGPQSVAWAANVSAGASDEAAQALDFIVTNSNTPLFSAQPAISAGGTLSYTPAPNANGSATVTVRLHDSGGTAGGGVDTSAPQTFVIAVTPVNDVPVAFADQVATTQGVAVTIPVLANDTDVDGSTLSVASVSASAGAIVDVNPDGTVTYRPAPDFLGSDTFSYRAADGSGGMSAPATVTVIVGLKTVTAAATPNVAVATGTSAVPADPIQTSVTSPVAATVSMTTGVVSESNPPADFTLLNQQVNITVVAANGTEVVASLANPLRLTFTIDASTIPVNETIGSIQILRNDQVLTECARATAIPAGQDPCVSSRTALGGTDSGDFQFTVLATHASRWNFGLRRQLTQPSATNDRYTITGIAALSVPAPGVLGNDLAKNATSATLVTAPGASAFTLNPNGGFTFTPASCEDVSFTYTATDKNGTSNIATATIAVRCAPVAGDDTFTTAEDTPVSGNVLVGDTRDPQAGALQAVKVSGPANGSVTLNGDGSFTYTPALNYNGADSFTYKVNDGAQDSAPATVRLTVTPVNDPPTTSNVADQTSTGGVVGPLAVTVGDVDDATGASLTLTVSSSNTALTTIALGGSGTNRTVTVTPIAGQTGQATITLTVDDGKGATAQDTFVLTVTSLQVAPTISFASSATTATTYGQSITYTSTVSGSKGTPTGTVTFYDGTSALSAAVALDATGKATFATTTTPAGTRLIKATYSGDSNYTSLTSAAITQTVNQAAATATLTLAAVQKQYSDRVGATVTVSPVDAAQSVTFKSGTRVLGTYDVVGGQAVVNVPMLNVTLGANMVTAVFNQTVANYTVPSPIKPITIAVEDATVAYANSTDVIICGTCANTLTLTATVKDINVTNPLGDPDPGDIGNANVSFVNRATGLTIGTVKVVPSATDARIGTATFSWPLTISAGSSQSYTIGMVVGSYYRRNSTTDNVTVKVTKQ